ncbi:gluconokinase [Paenibacillus sp. 1P07SE]|uniref:gluconokinase n=1 Tax=Paenibacillus sp. 1P07SE TaxID=3132209 RepID=UPI0039A6F7FD
MNEQSPVVVAVDIGTTSVKSLLITQQGKVVDCVTVGYPMMLPRPNMAEQDPDVILAAVKQGVGTLMSQTGCAPGCVSAVSFSSAMHSLIALDDEGRPLTGSIIWADQRSAAHAEALQASGEGLAIYRRTGTPIHPMSPLTKLLWMQEHRPDVTATARHYVGIKEYVLMQLFGQCVVDYSVASATGLFNLRELAWDREALALTGVEASQLPKPVPVSYQLSGLSADDAAAMGLRTDTVFVIGASDGVLANLGIGVMSPDRVAVSIGTSSAVRTIVPEPTLDSEGKLFCYALDEHHWAIGGASNNAGIVLRWLADQLLKDDPGIHGVPGEDPFVKLLEQAERVQPGANGLLFLPMLTGERAPYWNADSRGVFFGLSLSHGKPHMVRAAVEGILAQIAQIVQLMERMEVHPQEVCASGGLTRSRFICQLLSDMLGLPVIVPEIIESSGLGAAMIGFEAVGLQMTPAVDSETEAREVRYEPNPAHRHVYERLLPLHAKVYEGLQETFREVTELQAADEAQLTGVLN